MVREFRLPDVGEGLAEAEIIRWLVEPGDKISEDQPLAEVETDKAVVEVPSPINGTVQEILVDEGDIVEVGEVIITFNVDGKDDSATDEDSIQESSTADERVFASPSVRRLARELDADIDKINGSGSGGRILEHDVRTAAEQEHPTDNQSPSKDSQSVSSAQPEDDLSLATASTSEDTATKRDQTLATPATRALSKELGVSIDEVPPSESRDGEAFVSEDTVREYAQSKQESQVADPPAKSGMSDSETFSSTAPEKEDKYEPYRGLRRTIGQQMEQSKFTAPHVTHHDEVDVTALVETRETLKSYAEEQDIKLSYMPFVMKAVVAALKQFPILNSQLAEENEEIIYKQEYNIGVATATDDGLLVPVIDNVDQRSLLQVAAKMNELVRKARDRKLSRDEMNNGTFTITNIGAIGGEYATPIINHPETAILALGALKEKPRVVDGEVVPRMVMKLSLSIDHRVIDGADAAKFTNCVKEYLSDPTLLLLE
jgi:pyruvate dehydrogenase E2 component (dihydrolipoamide acetyltransferase)